MKRLNANSVVLGKTPRSIFNKFRLFYFLIFSAVGVFVPYLGLFLSSKGINGVRLGILLGLIPLVQIFVQPLWGYFSDILKARRVVLGASLIALGFASLGFMVVNSFAAMLGVIIVYAVVNTPYVPVSSALTLEYLESIDRQGEFGALRLWGSIGFVISSLLVGTFLLEGYLSILPSLYAGLLIFSGIIALFLPDVKSRESMDWTEGLKLLPAQPNLLVFFVGMGLVGAVIAIASQYLPVYLGSINAPGWIMGSVVALQALTEIPLMSRAQWIVRKLGLQTAILMGLLILPVRFVLYTVIENPIWLLPVQLLHGATILSLMVLGTLYVSETLPARWRATGQGLYTTFYGGLGSSLGLFAAGVLNDWHGMGAVWLGSMLVSLLSILIVRISFSNSKTQRERSVKNS